MNPAETLLARWKRGIVLGCNLCDDCSECTVGGSFDCGGWDPDERKESRDFCDYDTGECYDIDYDGDADYEEVREVAVIDAERNQYCKNCYAPTAANWSYCPACGTFLSYKYCISCDWKTTEVNWKFCPRCGSMLHDPRADLRPIHIPPDTPIPEEYAYDDSDIPF